MTPQNMQEAREILNAWNWNPSPELGPEGIRLQELIALALQTSHSEGVREGLEKIKKMREACEQGKNRIENFEIGFKLSGEPETVFQMHVLVMMNAIKQDFEEALSDKN